MLSILTGTNNIRAAIISVLVLSSSSVNLFAGESETYNLFSPPSSIIDFYQKYVSDLRYGHCRFDPSCSNYAREAIGKFGVLKGSAYAADRLVRCHGNSAGYYKKTGDGRLADPVEAAWNGSITPEAPGWLLPSPDFLEESSEGIFSERQEEYKAFADLLAEEGDCWRAATEYRRVAFLGGSNLLDYWARMMSGNCHFRRSDWNEAGLEYLEAAESTGTLTLKNAAFYMAAISDFNDGHYSACSSNLRKCVFDDRRAERSVVDIEMALILRGLCSITTGEWKDGAERFEAIVTACPGSPYAGKARYLSRKAAEGGKMPRKNGTMASVFSAILPGSGQVYAGRGRDGFRHFIFNGLLIYSVYSLIKEESYAAGYLLGGFTLPFYVGNIVGAKNSAARHNADKLGEFVSALLKEDSVE